MIRDITVGQYYASDSAIHRLDPRVKILGTMAFVVMLFIINDIYSYAFSILALALVIAISKVPSSFIFRGIKSILFIIFLTAILNFCFSQPVHSPSSKEKGRKHSNQQCSFLPDTLLLSILSPDGPLLSPQQAVRHVTSPAAPFENMSC